MKKKYEQPQSYERTTKPISNQRFELSATSHNFEIGKNNVKGLISSSYEMIGLEGHLYTDDGSVNLYN